MTQLNTQNIGQYSYNAKTLSTAANYSHASAQAKNLGGVAGDPSLAGWVETNGDLYQSILNGTSGLSQDDQNQFMSWWNWAQSQITGSSWGNGADMSPVDPFAGTGTGSMPQGDPFGGMPGTMNNIVHTDEKANVGFIGNVTRDYWSNDITINVAPASATITAENTTDTRYQPPEVVIKITITDKATGMTETHFVHDADDAKIKITSPAQSQFTDNTGGKVTWSKFNPNQGGQDGSDEVDAPIETTDDGVNLVEVPYGQKVKLTPTGQGEGNQDWEIYANFDLQVRPSDQVTVNPIDGGGYTVVVTHKDGSTDSYKIHKGFKGNIAGYPDNISWGDPASGGGVGESIPNAFKADFTLNASQTATGDASTPATQGTQPDSVDGTNDNYTTSQDVEIYTDFSDEITDHSVSAPGTLTIHATSYRDSAEVTKQSDGSYQVLIFKDGITDPSDPKYKVETYNIDGVTKIQIDGVLAKNVTGGAAQDGIVQIGDTPAAGNADTTPPAQWDSGLVTASVPSTGDNTDDALDLMGRINEAIRTGDWSQVQDFMSNDDSMNNDGAANNVIRKIVTAIYVAAESDPDKFKALMKLIPENVRTTMKHKVTGKSDELHEIQSGDQWNSAGTGAMIEDSFSE